MFHTVLVPLDGSAFAEQALPWAAMIARRAGADIELVHEHVLYALHDPAASWLPFDGSREREWQQQERHYLDTTADWLARAAAVSARPLIVKGLEADGILERIRAGAADLVVMAAHRRSPIGRLFHRGVADPLIRKATASVLLIRPPRESPEAVEINPEPYVERIVIPLDGSALAEEALEPAFGLGHLLESRCTLLRVITPPSIPADFTPYGGRIPRGDQARASSYLEAVAQRAHERGFRVDTRVVVGTDATTAVLEKTGEGDLIALATHGFAGLQRMLLGSVADRIIRAAANPVLVYRPAAITT
jgi:nucleotide-binding universal stress UspA family protein